MQAAENANPSMLAWARQAAGLSEEEAARRVGLAASKRSTAVDKLVAIESGATRPTRHQLLRFADAYRRPPTVFYLASPPAPGRRGEDFRTTSGPPPSPQEAALLDALLRDVRVRQSMVKAALEEDEDAARPNLNGRLSLDDRVPDAVATLRSALDVGDDWRRGINDPFAFLRSRVEHLGAFVLLVGDLGSHHTAVSERVFRGFALADAVAPFIVVNHQDATAARPFTLLHELAHTCLGASGVSADPPSTPPRRSHDRIEFFCNDVAGEFLLPSDAISSPRRIGSFDEARKRAEDVARERRVSEAMVAYRLWRNDRIERDIYRRLHAFYARRWQEEKERQRARMREVEGGPSYYVVRRYRLGEALISLVSRQLQAEEVTHTKAAKILGVKPSNVEPLLMGKPSVGSPTSP